MEDIWERATIIIKKLENEIWKEKINLKKPSGSRYSSVTECLPNTFETLCSMSGTAKKKNQNPLRVKKKLETAIWCPVFKYKGVKTICFNRMTVREIGAAGEM